MIFGIIFVGYNCEDLIQRSLAPWVEAKRGSLDGHTLKICAVSVPFIGFEQPPEPDSTHSYLDQSRLRGDIDHVILNHDPVKETEARGVALKWLVGQGVDATWMCDGDEVFSQSDISGAARFVEGNPWVMAFRIAYRNLVFDEKHCLVEPFTPFRIHRVYAHGGHKACGFWDDNNVLYNRPWMVDGPVTQDIVFSSMSIPASSANPLHFSWLNNERSRKKISYQRERWGHSSYRWNDQTNSLEFDPSYFAARGLPFPEVISI